MVDGEEEEGGMEKEEAARRTPPGRPSQAQPSQRGQSALLSTVEAAWLLYRNTCGDMGTI